MFTHLNSKERIGYSVLIGMLLAIVGLVGYRSTRPTPPNLAPSLGQTPKINQKTTKTISPLPDSEELVVYVTGAVRTPGVYHLKQSARTQDAVSAAGGATTKADLEQINLASKLIDGQQVRVPTTGEANATVQRSSGQKVGLHGSVSLNSASLEELEQLPGVGPGTAQRIVDYRNAHGGFTTVDQLRQVGGIGAKKLERLSPYLRL